MRKRTFTSSAGALLLLTASVVSAKHNVHEHLEALHRRHRADRLDARSSAETGGIGVEVRAVSETSAHVAPLEKRGQCTFPTDAGLVAVTPGSQNAGWAMSPDQPCKPGSYCPYACPPGQVSMQWDPSATSYTYPQSMNGGLYCDNSGNIQKPFPDKPYCQSTATNIGVVNNAGGVVSFCQTVLPGNEAMLIPTAVTSSATLAMPDTSYWCGTAAHYYINPPGTDTETACVWGNNANPFGNWSPYVAGGNVDASGETFIKLGWNPIYLEAATPFRNTMPNWGVKIDCPNGGCNGLPCAIDPSQNQVNQMVGSATDGAGGGAFCVVTVAKGSTANFVVYSTGGDQSSGSNTGGPPGGGPPGYGGNNGNGNPNGGGFGNKGGQFFQSSSAAASPTTSAEPSWTQSSTSSTTSAEWSSWASAESNSWPASPNTKEASSTTPSSRAPTHSPYYSIFHNATTGGVPTATESVWTAPVPSAPAAKPSFQTATGAASTFSYSLTLVLSCLSAVLYATV